MSIIQSRVVMVGPFPPPVHGMAAVNVSVWKALCEAGAAPLVIDMAAPSLERSLFIRLGRLPRIICGVVQLSVTPQLRGQVLYMSATPYDFLFALLARLRGMRIFLHHHVFAYLDRPSLLARCLISVAGRDAVHIVKSPAMAVRLKKTYRVKNTLPMSNVVYFRDKKVDSARKDTLQKIGFLSNILVEKGIFEFLDLLEACNDLGLPLEAQLAGPFQDEKIERAVRKRLAALPIVEYVGARYGREKEAFFDGIDAFVFPTRYHNEAEPWVIHEAMSHGIPIIAYGRGCIPEIVGEDCGCVVDPSEPFVPDALEQIRVWLADVRAFQDASTAAAKRFTQTYVKNERRWRSLITELIA